MLLLVFAQITGAQEARGAVRTQERFLAGVRSLVLGEHVLLLEARRADVTRVRSRVRVRDHVLTQPRDVREDLAANLARYRLRRVTLIAVRTQTVLGREARIALITALGALRRVATHVLVELTLKHETLEAHLTVNVLGNTVHLELVPLERALPAVRLRTLVALVRLLADMLPIHVTAHGNATAELGIAQIAAVRRLARVSAHVDLHVARSLQHATAHRALELLQSMTAQMIGQQLPAAVDLGTDVTDAWFRAPTTSSNATVLRAYISSFIKHIHQFIIHTIVLQIHIARFGMLLFGILLFGILLFGILLFGIR